MGRLFWKFFFAIWLAQLTAGLGMLSIVLWNSPIPQSASVIAAESRSFSIPPAPSGGVWAPIGLGFLTSVIFSAGLAWYLSKPIRHLRSAFAALAQGQLGTRVGPSMGRRRDELADLGRSFDDMADRIGTLVDAQRRLLHDVSHELRSPLARLHAAIGLARRQPEEMNASFDRIEREAGRLDDLVGEVLTLSRLEAGVPGAEPQDFDFGEVLDAIIVDARFEADAKGVTLLCEACSGAEIPMSGHPELLYRAIENIVRNAIKHTPGGRVVRLRVGTLKDHRCLLLTVADQGPGVPEAQLESIFEPFYRGADGFDSSGYGWGWPSPAGP